MFIDKVIGYVIPSREDMWPKLYEDIKYSTDDEFVRNHRFYKAGFMKGVWYGLKIAKRKTGKRNYRER